MTDEKVLKKLLAHIDVHDTTGCWLWTGARDKYGYAIWKLKTLNYVYQIAYEIFRAEIPRDNNNKRLDLDHVICDNGHRGCCNPWHVEPVTHEENVKRSHAMEERGSEYWIINGVVVTKLKGGHVTSFTPPNLKPMSFTFEPVSSTRRAAQDTGSGFTIPTYHYKPGGR